jgi:urease accessory protein UreF
MTSHIPSLAALESNTDGRLAAELRLVDLRSQAAIVRALADDVERFSREAEADGLARQLIEEMARLGARLLEAAAAFEDAPHVEDSGVFPR